MRSTFTHITTGGGIYTITNKFNRKVYVGSSGNIRHRLYVHLNALERGTHINTHLQAAWKKYGRDAFIFAVLELESNKEARLIKETAWITSLQADTTHKGYNMTSNAAAPMLGKKHSEETRMKFRKIHAERSLAEKEEIRERLIQAATKPRSDQFKNKLKVFHQEHPEIAARLNSPEIRAKQIEAAKARKGIKLSVSEEEKNRRRERILAEIELNRGSKWAHNPTTNEEYFIRDGVLPPGLQWGRSKKTQEAIRSKLKGNDPGRWAVNTETGQSCRVIELPQGWKWGRKV